MIAIALFLVFALAAVAGVTYRLAPRATGLVLAAYPGCVAVTILATAHHDPVIEAYRWIPALGLEVGFFVDGVSRLFALLVCGVGAIVLVYAGAYLKGHPHLGRMYTLLLLFMGSMLGIVVADNLVLLFVFWELTSITSYLLIGFNHERAEARASALQALIVTGGGGLALLAGILLLGNAGGTLAISELLARAAVVQADPMYPAALGLVLIGAFTKSAQVPFHFWLPAAMAAPTPVSAYLHSSTMVKAGVFLLARLSPVLGGTVLWTASVSTAGGLTMLIGAWLAFRSRELKRLLAYSTISALGVMTLLIGLGSQPALIAALVFLLAHAFYKGALFLVVGTIDHETGERDIRRLGGLGRAMPFTAAAAILAALSMAGVPPLVGFVAKELALEAAAGATALGWASFAAVALTGTLLVAVAAMAVSPFLGARPDRLSDVGEGSPALWGGALLLAVIGALAALFPAGIVPLLSSASAAVAGAPVDVSLALWHGVTPALIASAAALLAGGLLFTGRDRLPVGEGRLPVGLTPSGWYSGGIELLSRVAAWQTAAIQSGLLRHYLLATMGITLLLTGGAFVARHGVAPSVSWTDIRVHEAGLALLMVLAAAGAMHSRSRLASVAALGVIGYSIALIFAMFGALDLALTQLLVETLTVIVLVLVLYNVPAGRLPVGTIRWRDLAVAGSAGALMTIIVLAAAGPSAAPISDYFIDQAIPAAHGRNVVNVILVDFRALDTLGEIAVLGIAATGVYALLRLRPRGEVQS